MRLFVRSRKIKYSCSSTTADAVKETETLLRNEEYKKHRIAYLHIQSAKEHSNR